VDKIAAERRMSPLEWVRRNNVDMAVEEKRRCIATTLDTSNEVGSILLQRQVPVLDFGALEEPAGELDARSFVSWRVRRVEPDQRLEQLDLIDRCIHAGTIAPYINCQ
jgi:hypothetical protein